MDELITVCVSLFSRSACVCTGLSGRHACRRWQWSCERARNEILPWRHILPTLWCCWWQNDCRFWQIFRVNSNIGLLHSSTGFLFRFSCGVPGDINKCFWHLLVGKVHSKRTSDRRELFGFHTEHVIIFVLTWRTLIMSNACRNHGFLLKTRCRWFALMSTITGESRLSCTAQIDAVLTEVFEVTQQKFGRVGIVVNNCGILQEFNWQQCVDINLVFCWRFLTDFFCNYPGNCFWRTLL